MIKNPIAQGVILATIVGLATAASNTLTASASKSDVVKALEAHGMHPHAPTELRLARMESAHDEHSRELARLEGVPEELRGIRARLDLMLMHQGDSPRRRRAATKLRKAARARGESGDPLHGLEGL